MSAFEPAPRNATPRNETAQSAAGRPEFAKPGVAPFAAGRGPVDLLQAWHRLLLRLRGAGWTLVARLVMRAPVFGGRLSCIGWPRLTHRNGKLIIGKDCFLGSGELKIAAGGVLLLGSRVLLNDGFVVSANQRIEIGDDTLVGEYVSIHDADHASARRDIPIAAQGMRSTPIRIGEDVWIGRGAVILKGVTIGRGAIVGANSVVTRSVAPYAIVAGAPARRIGDRP